jgi:hypothetical protein
MTYDIRDDAIILEENGSDVAAPTAGIARIYPVATGWKARGTFSPVALGGTYPKVATLWHHSARVVIGGALIRELSDTARFAVRTYQTDAQVGAAVEWDVLLAAGIYQIIVSGESGPYAGTQHWYVDGVLKAALRWSANSVIANDVRTASGVVIPTDGRHVIRSEVGGPADNSTSQSSAFVIFSKASFVGAL